MRLLPLVAIASAQFIKRPAVELVTVVLTVPAHGPQRAAIRDGYGQRSTFSILLWFVVSNQDAGFWDDAFQAERQRRRDVVVCGAAGSGWLRRDAALAGGESSHAPANSRRGWHRPARRCCTSAHSSPPAASCSCRAARRPRSATQRRLPALSSVIDHDQARR